MKRIKLVGAALAISIVSLYFYFQTHIHRLYHVLHLFDEDRIVENFRTMDKYFPFKTLEGSSSPYQYRRGSLYELPNAFSLNGNEVETQFFLDGSKTTGLFIIQDGEILFEEYYLGNTDTTRNISWSMAKSFVSTLLGIAVDEGYVASILDPVDTYVPELIGSAYEGVTIKNILQMSSGVKFNEDYGGFNSDINRWGRAFALGQSQDEFAKSLTVEREQGTFNHYVSIDTHVIAMLITQATGKSLTEYMQEKLWDKIGMEHDGYWSTDDKGTEVALCGLNATLRDYAKLGSLYLNEGKWNGEQVVSAQWIRDAITPDAPHLLPGKDNPDSAHELGYGYQWWIPEGDEGEYLAQGVYNQNIYVNPTTKTVIVKLSANDRFNDEDHIPSQWQAALSFYRKIVTEIN